MDAFSVTQHLATAAEVNCSSYLATIAAKASTQAYDQSLVLPFPSLDPSIKAAVAKSFSGVSIRFCGDKAASVPLSGHTFHSVFRYAVRARFESKLPVATETLPTLIIGSAFREVKEYEGNPNVSYWFYANEPKDTDRIIRPMLKSLASRANALARKSQIKFQDRTLAHQNVLTCLAKVQRQGHISLAEWRSYFPKVRFPINATEAMHTLLRLKNTQNPTACAMTKDARFLRVESVYDLLNTYNKVVADPKSSEPGKSTHFRQFTWGPDYRITDQDRRPYRGVLHDVGYSFDDKTWFKVFETTGITVADGYMFCPHRLHFPDMVPDPTYTITLVKNQPLVNPLAAWCSNDDHWRQPVHTVARLTFNGDDGNGYEEDFESWKSYLNRRVMFDPKQDRGYALLLDILERQGDYIIYRVCKVTTRISVPWAIQVPVEQHYVRVFDVLAHCKSLSSPESIGPSQRTYISVLKSEWQELMLYIGRQNPSSVCYHLVLTSAYRKAFAILEAHDTSKRWKVEPERLQSVALAALLYHSSLQNDLDATLSNSQTPYALELRNMLKDAFLVTCGCTINRLKNLVGSAIPLVTHPDLEEHFYNSYDAVDSCGNSTLPDTVDTHLDVSIAILPGSESENISCHVCKSLFPISQMGQTVTCDCVEDSSWEFVLSSDDRSALSARLSQQISEHSTNADSVGLHKVLSNARAALPVLPISYKTNVLVYTGGAGVGKTRIISTLRTNKDDLVVAPYDLSAAYRNSPADFMTHHKALANQKIYKRVIVDEFQSMDLDLLTVILSKAQPQVVELHGDPKQPNILENQGEGRSIVHHVLSKKNFTTHTYGLSYRCTLSSTCILNNVFGYNLCTNSDTTDDIVLTPFDSTWFEKHPTVPAISFDAKTVASMLGTTKNPKASVRSATGSTHEELALVVRNEDLGLLKVDSLSIVAISRHTKRLYLIYETENVRAALVARFSLDKIAEWSKNPPRTQTTSNGPNPRSELLDDLTTTFQQPLHPDTDDVFKSRCGFVYVCGCVCQAPMHSTPCNHKSPSICTAHAPVMCDYTYKCGIKCNKTIFPGHEHNSCDQNVPPTPCQVCCSFTHTCKHRCEIPRTTSHLHSSVCRLCNPHQILIPSGAQFPEHHVDYPVRLYYPTASNEPMPTTPSYQYHDTMGDGDCMYHAVCESFKLINRMHGTALPTSATTLRMMLYKSCVNLPYLKTYAATLFSSLGPNGLQKHMAGVAGKEWGTDLDLQLISSIFNVSIRTVDLHVERVFPKVDSRYAWAGASRVYRRFTALSQVDIEPFGASSFTSQPIVYIGHHGAHFAHLTPFSPLERRIRTQLKPTEPPQSPTPVVTPHDSESTKTQTPVVESHDSKPAEEPKCETKSKTEPTPSPVPSPQPTNPGAQAEQTPVLTEPDRVEIQDITIDTKIDSQGEPCEVDTCDTSTSNTPTVTGPLLSSDEVFSFPSLSSEIPGTFKSPSVSPVPYLPTKLTRDNMVKPLSHALSSILRHNTSKLKLDVDGAGYVPLDQVLSCKYLVKSGAKSVPISSFSQSDIENVVAHQQSDKQRFGLGKLDGKVYIKANQGHSDVDLDPDMAYTRVTDAVLVPACIHGTYRKHLRQILATGLSRMNRKMIHFATGLPSDKVISGMRGDADVAIYIDVQGLLADNIPLYRSDNGVLLTDGINGLLPSKYFSKILDIKTNKTIPFSKPILEKPQVPVTQSQDVQNTTVATNTTKPVPTKDTEPTGVSQDTKTTPARKLWSDDEMDSDSECPCGSQNSLVNLLSTLGYPKNTLVEIFHDTHKCRVHGPSLTEFARRIGQTLVVTFVIVSNPTHQNQSTQILTSKRCVYGNSGPKLHLKSLMDISDSHGAVWSQEDSDVSINTVNSFSDLSDPAIIVHPVSWSKYGILVHVPADLKCAYNALKASARMLGVGPLFDTILKNLKDDDKQYNVPAIDEDYQKICDTLDCAIRIHHALPDLNSSLYTPTDTSTPSFTLNIVIKDFHAHALLPQHPSYDTTTKRARKIAEWYRNLAGGLTLVPNPGVFNPVPQSYLDLTTHYIKPADESYQEVSVPDERSFFAESTGIRPYDGFKLIEDIVDVRSNLQSSAEEYGSLTPLNISHLTTKMIRSRASVNIPNLIQPLNKSKRPLQDEISRHRYMHSQGIDFLASCPAQELRTAHTRYVSSKGIKLTAASKALARKISDNFAQKYMKRISEDSCEESQVLNEALTDAIKKHYPERVRDFATFDHKRINFFMKEIFKVSRSHDTDASKAGQGISAWDPTVVALFHTLMRIMSRRFARSLKPNAVFNNRLTQVELIEKVRTAMGTVPKSAIGGYMDGTQFDSCQNAFTQEIEKNIMIRLGMPLEALQAYYLIRNDYLLSSNTLSAIIDSAKTSGEPGTLLFNTILMMCLTAWLLKTKTMDTVIVGQGDDCFIYGIGLHLDEDEISNVSNFTKMKLKCQIGGRISFCGMSYSNGKFFLDLERRYKKLVGTTFRDYQHFAEVQNSIRDFVLDVKRSDTEGISSTIKSNIHVPETHCDYIRQFLYLQEVFHALESLTHIDAKQFRTHYTPVTISRTEPL
jgi:2'-phosphotransferase